MFSIFDIESNLHRLSGYEDIYFSEDKYSHNTSLFTIINGIILKVQKKDCKDFEKFIQAKEINLKHVCDDNCNIYASFDN